MNISLSRVLCLVLTFLVFIPNTTSADYQLPSFEPTFSPTAESTLSPTVQSTVSPTRQLTIEPTFSPTTTLTNSPLSEPSFPPTFEPSFAPTFEPSFAPTFEPSFAPTFEPSFAPTFEPSFTPTFEPSKEAGDIASTFAPTHAPTSETGNIVDSLQPTPTPTSNPTLIPRKKDIQNAGSGGLYTVYLIGLVLAVIGTFYFLVRNYGDHFGFNYTPVNTVGDDDEEAPLNSRDVELARFQRMAESMRSYPPPPGSPRNNRR